MTNDFESHSLLGISALFFVTYVLTMVMSHAYRPALRPEPRLTRDRRSIKSKGQRGTANSDPGGDIDCKRRAEKNGSIQSLP